MGAIVIVGATSAAVAAASPGSVDRLVQWQPHIVEASRRFALPESWIRQVMAAESGGQITRNGKPIRSRVGAMGLMQLMPATWAAMRDALQLGSDPDDPHDNIIAGAAYLRAMYDSFGYPGLFAAYNAGPGRYADFLAGRRGLPKETRSYLQMITARLEGKREAGHDVVPPIFVSGKDDRNVTPDALFVIKRDVP